MVELLRFVTKYEIGIYIILGAIFLVYLRRMLSALFALSKAKFGLEREFAQKNLRLSITIIFLVFLFSASNFVLVSFAAVRFPGLNGIPTPTVDLAATPESNSTGAAQLTPEAVQQTQTAIALTGCIPDQLEWVQPQSGDEVSGSVELKGTVNIPNLGFYKYEYQLKGDNIWTPISAGNKPIVAESFGGRWNTEQLDPGNYSLRLVVSDNQNNLLQPCVIDVKVIP